MTNLLDADFFTNLREFLPRRVSLQPSYKAGVIAFFVCILIASIAYKVYGIPGNKTDRKEAFKLRMTQFVYALSVFTFAAFFAQSAFDYQFYRDNRAINGNWLTYKKYFPTLFR
jgi:hypothetical protein